MSKLTTMRRKRQSSGYVQRVIVFLLRLTFFRFNAQDGVWQSIFKKQRIVYCAKCFSESNIIPMREFSEGYYCQHCDSFTIKSTKLNNKEEKDETDVRPGISRSYDSMCVKN